MKLLKRILLLIEVVYHLENKTKINEIVEEKSYEFRNLKEKINPDNLIYKYKTEGRSLKDFSVYQNLIDLFINLRGGNLNPRETLKNQIYFKSDLGEIKRENSKSKPEDQINRKCAKYFWFKRKNYYFL